MEYLLQPQLGAADDQALDLAGAFVDLGDLGVAEVALDRVFLAVADPAVDLDRGVGAEHGRLGGKQFGGRGLQRELLAGLLERCLAMAAL
jgi:hypothetical protein